MPYVINSSRPHESHFSQLITRLTPTSTLFPYTTLFRSKENCVRCHSPKGIAAKASECMTCHTYHAPDRKSTRLNSSHVSISYAVFCLKKKMTDDVVKVRRWQ